MPVPGVLTYCSKGPWLPWENEEVVREASDLAGGAGAHTLKIEPEVLSSRTDVKALLGNIGFHEAR